MGQVIFVTGTDTGVGKTLLTTLLLVYLRQQGRHALAMKPFCTGSLHDARTLSRAQHGEVPLERITPYFYRDPIAPLVAARRARRLVKKADVLQKIRAIADDCDVLLVEGAGGLLVPLGPGYSIADLIEALSCPVVVVVRNRLGAVNHTLLTLAVLQPLALPSVKVALLDGTPRMDLATQTNARLIAELASPTRVFRIPFLGRYPERINALEKNAKSLKKTLARILKHDTFSAAFRESGQQITEQT